MANRKTHLHNIRARIAAAALAAAMALCSTTSAFAKEPGVTVDEAMYINADYYGAVEKITVVKGVNTNGLTEFKDHGDYLRVDNMTDRTEPVISGSSVTWRMEEGRRRFYFSGELASVELPWSFDVSYLHNGQPADPSRLAGASGLVEIQIKAVPNEKASQYYKNNMLLQVLVTADMEKVNSIQAEGAQLQSAGKNTVALFLGLPGEEQTYRVRIGTDCFESPGVIMAMIPATASQLSQIKDLKKTMDQAEEAGDALYSGIDAMLSAVASMKPGLDQVKGGVKELEEARKVIDGSVDGVLERIDAMTASMKETSDALCAMDDEMEQSQKDMNNLGAQMRKTKRQLSDVTEEMEDLQDDAEDLLTEYMENYVAEQVTKNKTLTSEIKKKASAQVAEQVADLAKEQAVKEAGGMEAFASLSQEEQAALVGGCAQKVQGDAETMDKLSAQATSDAKKSVLTEERLRKEIPYYANVKKLQSSLKSASSELSFLEEGMETLLSDSNTALSGVADLIKETRPLLEKTSKLLISTTDLMDEIKAVVEDSRPYLQSGAEKSAEGLVNTLDQTMTALDSTAAVKSANRTLKRIIDDEMDSLREENRLLEIDPQASLQSCTSLENPQPNTLQIILRTEEITLENQKEVISDMEQEGAKLTPFQRMEAIFKKIIAAVVRVFEEEA